MGNAKSMRRVLVRLGAGLLLILTSIACAAPPSIEGTPYGRASGRDNASQKASEKDDSDGTKRPKSRTNDPSPMHETEDPGATASGQPSEASRPSPAPAAAPTEAPTTVPTAAPPAAPTTTPAPRVASCQSANPDACFDCCLAANPGASGVENAYDACLANAFDDFEASLCANQHQSQCNGSAACLQHHACLQANGCFDSLS